MCEPDKKPEQRPSFWRRSDVFRGWSALSWPMRLLMTPIYFYRLFLSPLWPHTCRFEPSCSAYALDAFATHGPIRGFWLALRRVSRCHPFERLGGGQGYDPVPPRRDAEGRVAHGSRREKEPGHGG